MAAQKELVKEGIHFKKQWEMVEAKVDSLQTKITDMTTSLSEARTENKALSAKLAASRAAEAAATKVPRQRHESRERCLPHRGYAGQLADCTHERGASTAI